MKLKRIRIEQLRQFGRTFELPDLAPGLNLFTGPNEAGKSTVVRAIRAAFFERYRSSDVKDLVPHDDSAAGPSVELDFEAGGLSYALRKVWLRKNRCELSVGTQRFDGDDAEAQLAQLLGFGFAKKGASRAEHWGVPGLLWIEQGTGQELQTAVLHAADHLRGALQTQAAEVASTQGDAVIAQVEAHLSELLTGAKRTPRAEFARVIEDVDRLEAERAQLQANLTGYRQQVDELTTLAAAHTVEHKTRPWEKLRRRQAQTQAKLRDVEQHTTALHADQHASAQINQQIALLQGQLENFEARHHALQGRQLALTEAEQKAADAAKAGNVWTERQQQSQLALREAEQHLAAARTEDLRGSLSAQCRDAEQQIALLDTQLEAAEQEATALRSARDVEAQTSLTLAALQALRQRHADLRELQIRREAVQTRIGFEIDPSISGDRVLLDGTALRGSGNRFIESAATLAIAGVGSITIVPGRSDAGSLLSQESELQAANEADFQQLGVPSLAGAETRYLRHEQAQGEIARASKALARLAPKGLETLREDRAARQRRLAEAAQKLTALPPARDAADTAPVSLADASVRHDAARAGLDDVMRQAQIAQQTLSGARAKLDLAQQEHRALSTELAALEQLQRRAEAQRSLTRQRAEHQLLTTRIEQRTREIEQQQPAALADEIERLDRSAAHAQDRFLEREKRIAQLRGQLEASGAQGLDERLAVLASQLESTRRRHGELKLRADALSLLLELLVQQRREATQRLQAPLQKHVTRYLQLLFAGARLDIADDLTPTLLVRTDGAGPSNVPLDALSFGAREQMGILSRLAYADLLKEAGRPTLIILDDALVHSDEQRLQRMKNVLYDAAKRHQILLFTCHQNAWLDSGAPARVIEK